MGQPRGRRRLAGRAGPPGGRACRDPHPRRRPRLGGRALPAGLGAARGGRRTGPADAGERQGRPARGPAPGRRRGGSGPVRVFSVPLSTRFRGITVREGALLEGDAGWGEWSPFLEYDAEVAEPWLRCAEEAAAGDWPEPVRSSVPVNATVPVVSPEAAYDLVRRSGCTTAKVKVADPGTAPAEDLARVEAVRDALGPDGRIRVDANGAWDVEAA